MPSPGAVQGQSTTWHDDSFTDSTGRTLLYRYWVRSDWDLTAPRGVVLFFHGNNHGTAEELRQSKWSEVETALDLGLAFVVPASPQSYPEDLSYGESTLIRLPVGSGGSRGWEDEDARLIHELLQSNLKSRLTVDYDRVVFSGGSQGTCFLAKFVELYGGSYGGGFHAWCGCFWLDFDDDDSHTPPFSAAPWRPSFQWTPFAASAVRDRFKVFVEATTEDFLYPDAVSMSRYYSEWPRPRNPHGPGGGRRDTASGAKRHGARFSIGCHRAPRRNILEVVTTRMETARRIGPTLTTTTMGRWTSSTRCLATAGTGAIQTVTTSPTRRIRTPTATASPNASDAFPLDLREWRDTDADGIGNTLDDDDDNDGLPDASDPQPIVGTDDGRNLAFVSLNGPVSGYTGTHLQARAHVHAARPAAIVYPAPQGHSQSYQFLELGNNSDARFEIMVDSFVRPESCPAVLLPQLCDIEQFAAAGYRSSYFQYFQDQFVRIWIDRNRNRDLTDDGPPLLTAWNMERAGGVSWTTEAVLEVPYASGQVLPYAIVISPRSLPGGLQYSGASVWRGEVEAPSGERVLATAVDGDVDGLFDSRSDAQLDKKRDFVCLDLDRNGLAERMRLLRGRLREQAEIWRDLPVRTVRLGRGALRALRGAVGPRDHDCGGGFDRPEYGGRRTA